MRIEIRPATLEGHKDSREMKTKIIKHVPTGKFVVSLIGKWDDPKNLTSDVCSAAPVNESDVRELYKNRDPDSIFDPVTRTKEI